MIETNNDEMDSFGRILGTLYADGVNINELMLESGHAGPWLDG